MKGIVNFTGTVELRSDYKEGDGIDFYFEVDDKLVGKVHTVLPTDKEKAIRVSMVQNVRQGTRIRMVVDPRKNSHYDGVKVHFTLHLIEHLISAFKQQQLLKALKEKEFDPRFDLESSPPSGLLYPLKDVREKVLDAFGIKAASSSS